MTVLYLLLGLFCFVLMFGLTALVARGEPEAKNDEVSS